MKWAMGVRTIRCRSFFNIGAVFHSQGTKELAGFLEALGVDVHKEGQRPFPASTQGKLPPQAAGRPGHQHRLSPEVTHERDSFCSHVNLHVRDIVGSKKRWVKCCPTFQGCEQPEREPMRDSAVIG
jgi:hypothetical protein